MGDKQIKLTIAIPTIIGREDSFERLLRTLGDQIYIEDARDTVEIIFEKDNKELTIGEKRNRLYDRAQGTYCVQIDDDDGLSPIYIKRILAAIELEPDCITYQEHCDLDGQIEMSDISLKYDDWGTFLRGPFKYKRTPFNICPIKTEICRKVRMEHVRWAEDHSFSKRIKPFLKKEIHIDEVLYFYKRIAKGQTHNQRYGIK